jgi:energy-converting hydrogenase B subunit D
VTAVQVAALLLVAGGGLAVVLQGDVLKQAIVVALYGLLLTVLFVTFQAPDVALSMLAVGSIAYPFVLLVAIARGRDETEETTDQEGE